MSSAIAAAEIGLVFALPYEIRPMVDRCRDVRKTIGHRFVLYEGTLGERRLALVQAGVGAKRAGAATEALLNGHQPRWIVAAGFAGSLSDEVRTGDLVMATEVADESGAVLAIDMRLGSEPASAAAGEGSRPARVHTGRLLSVDRIIRAAEEKRAVGIKHAALAVDMESMAVARVCRDRQVRFLAVRVISDDLSHDLPPEVLSVLGPSRTFRAGAIVGSLLKRTGAVKDLWRLRKQAKRAAERLAVFLEGVIRQLG